ncbi:MAG: hypothetical protein KDA58_02910 [Planctomycetaceae bacterium]|nr:hypothetical protein [Planctomycetaceae bacterium]
MTAEQNEQFRMLVQRLLDSTRAGRIEWEPGLNENTFVASLNHGIVEVRRIVGFPDELCDDDSPVEYFELTILTSNARVAERFSSEHMLSGKDTLQTPSDTLADLYRVARGQAMKSDTLINEIIGELA